jgi:hypothetical protein
VTLYRFPKDPRRVHCRECGEDRSGIVYSGVWANESRSSISHWECEPCSNVRYVRAGRLLLMSSLSFVRPWYVRAWRRGNIPRIRRGTVVVRTENVVEYTISEAEYGVLPGDRCCLNRGPLPGGELEGRKFFLRDRPSWR